MPMAESCQNCGEVIGALESAHVWGDHVVCTSCKAKLAKSSPVEKLGFEDVPNPDPLQQLAYQVRTPFPSHGALRSSHKELWPAAIICSILSLIVIALCLVYAWQPTPSKYTRTPITPVTTRVKEQPMYDPAMKLEREKFIERLKAAGVFESIRVGTGVGHAVAGPNFNALPFEAKRKFCDVALAWCLDSDSACFGLTIRDPRTNNKIGSYTAISGLTID